MEERNRRRVKVGIVTSNSRMAISNWSSIAYNRIGMAILLNKGEDENDNSSKKGSKIFKRICKIDIWNKELIHKR